MIASGPGFVIEPGEPGPPSWAQTAWAEDAAALVEILPGDADLTIAVTGDISGAGRLFIAGQVNGDVIDIHLSGDGWKEESTKARRLLQLNLAHELAHVPQRQDLDTSFEPVILHEGYAEARALDLLVEAKLWPVAEVRQTRAGIEQRCLMALARGRLYEQAEAGNRDATYACGAMLWLAASAKADLPLDLLYREYAQAMEHPAGLGPWLQDTLGREFTRSAIRFVTQDYSHAPAAALEGLAAGRL